MSNDRHNSHPPHIASQVAASWSAFDKAVRADQLADSLQNLNAAFESAMGEVQTARDFIGSPGSILGNSATKHGEIAEQVHVVVTRAFDVLHGRATSATFEGIGRTSAVDYRVNGVDIQSKYINGLRNTLDHVQRHAEKYPEFIASNSQYHIPRDQYQQLQELRGTGKIDGLSDRVSQSLSEKLEELQKTTGRKVDSLIQPGEASYQEVQRNSVETTLNSRERQLINEQDKLRETAKVAHGPSVQGFTQAAALGAVAGGGVQVAQSFWKKWKQEGKNPFLGDLTESDWREIGLDVAQGMGTGAISGGSLYLLTNATNLAAPFAGAMVSGLIGIGDLLRQYHENKISPDQFLELSLTVTSDAAIIGLATAAGQALIPIPILGALIGSISGQLITSTLKSTLGNSAEQLLDRLEQHQKIVLAKLDDDCRSIPVQVNQYFDNLEKLLTFVFDESLNTHLRLSASVQLAESCGVSGHLIIRSSEDLDQFMME